MNQYFKEKPVFEVIQSIENRGGVFINMITSYVHVHVLIILFTWYSTKFLYVHVTLQCHVCMYIVYTHVHMYSK